LTLQENLNNLEDLLYGPGAINVVARIEDLGVVEIVDWSVWGGGGGENDGKLRSTEGKERTRENNTLNAGEGDEGRVASLNAIGTSRRDGGGIHQGIHLFVDKFLALQLILSGTEGLHVPFLFACVRVNCGRIIGRPYSRCCLS